ncbi:MAG TPA: NUDIX domain-containing protein [Actinomycetota bacterium]|nr:NUDIX domain-containing protein [Actinomycetota bacterium]
MTSAGEWVDVVSDHDEVVGRTTREEVRARKLLHRGVAVVCRNPNGEIFVHKRTDTKDVFPGYFDMFISGLVTSGETYEQAARRELMEELGIIGPIPQFLFKERYLGEDNPHWASVYEVEWDGPVVHDPDEIASGGFITLEELLSRMNDWRFVPDGLQLFRRYLLQKQGGL